jgi:hypothetical protein
MGLSVGDLSATGASRIDTPRAVERSPCPDRDVGGEIKI